METHARFRKTKIVCTIGPATRSYERIRELIEAGMDVARLNFSHGNRESHRETVKMLRQASADVGKEIGILQDLGGPKIRLGELQVPDLKLETGGHVVLISAQTSDAEFIPVNYPYLLEDVQPGDRILLADGTVELSILKKENDRLVCEVLVGGLIQSHKGVNLPSSNLRVSSLTEKDREDLRVGLEEQVDFVALSFVRSEKDLEAIKEIFRGLEHPPLLIAKIEKPQAVENFERILAVVDGVMVARGDLGVEMPLEEVPIIQKRIIRVTRQMGKPVITATQMLRSMMENPRPTRAEATDVANAVLDGTDAVMLSDETAMGSYAIEAVATLDRIARATEPHLSERCLLDEGPGGDPPFGLLPATAAAISRAAYSLAVELRAAAIVAETSSGSTARLVARFRPPCPIIALTNHKQTQRQLTLSWGVLPDCVAQLPDTDQMFKSAQTWALTHKIARRGDRLIITAGVPVGVTGTTNLLKVMELPSGKDEGGN